MMIGRPGGKIEEEDRNKLPMIFDYVRRKRNIKVSYDFVSNEIVTLHKDELMEFLEEIKKVVGEGE